MMIKRFEKKQSELSPYGYEDPMIYYYLIDYWEDRLSELQIKNFKMSDEKKLNKENSNDIFTCQDCKIKTTRGEIRQKWKQIPFCEEKSKRYYCGCNGWG